MQTGDNRVASFDLYAKPHRRFNPLTQEWVLVSPQRTERPWQGQIEKLPPETVPQFDPACYLCPGNSRAGGAKNPQYKQTFVFDNDFAALRADTPEGSLNESGLLVAQSEFGRCRVVCFSPRHDLTLPLMSQPEIEKVIDVWIEEFKELGSHPRVNSVQIFENRGTMMGSSNPHPHGQIWANETLPNQLAKELRSFSEHYRAHSSTLLSDYLQLELKNKERVVHLNEHFVLLVPFWAVWPFETMLVSRRPVSNLADLTGEERSALAEALQQATVRYDNLFETSFPYTMGFHQCPTDDESHPEFHLHAHFYPPLLRSATVKKFMVGYEMLAMPQRDITAESAAERLRAVSSTHYSGRSN
jgi:UDPglucose--hexose-1-phosphate uridylyltransferase